MVSLSCGVPPGKFNLEAFVHFLYFSGFLGHADTDVSFQPSFHSLTQVNLYCT